ncbi:MAG: ABC transporter permease, partial [Clostridiales bacterium]|nr:ABC transporter permease [Clostridiales bacterium]
VDDLIGSTIDTLVSAMSAICFIFVALTCFVVILTEILLTRSQIIRERSELGVSKAIGYTSGELIRRMIMSTLPVVVIGVLVGFVLQVTLNNKMMGIGLSSFGIAKSNLSTNPLWFLVTLLIIVSCAVVTCWLNSRSISKLEPVRILKEE